MIKSYLLRGIFLTSVVCSTVYSQLQWQKGGNDITGGPPTIGTNGLWNAPLDFLTVGNNRMHINQNRLFNVPYFGSNGIHTAWYVNNYGGYGVLGPAAAPNGFVGINTTDPRTQLHIQGNQNCVSTIGSGWRPWMRTGVFMNEESNNVYVGTFHRGNCLSGPVDGVLSWGDDVGGSTPNRLRIMFNPSLNSFADPTGFVPAQVKDLEMMSFWSTRNVGIGDFINFTNGPVSQLHMHNEFANNNFLTITNVATGSGNSDGFKIGIDNASGRTALLRQTENDHMIFSTNAVGLIGERMRITHVGAPGVTSTTPLSLNSTRIGMALDPASPIVNPLSLLHLGYSTSVLDGWRPWMANGMFISQASDNMFIGMKQENYLLPTINRFDAVINWGDDMMGVPPIGGLGPDNLRFIFTSYTTAGDAASGPDGLEVARFSPNCPSCPLNKPSFGIGDFAPSGPQGGPGLPGYIGATLDVDGDARIRTVTNDPTLNQVLVIDPSDLNRVHYRDINGLYNSNNGIYNNNNLFQWGVSCNDPNFATNVSAYGIATPRSLQLTADFHFFDPSNGGGRIGIGSDATTNCTLLPNRLVIEALGPNQSGVRLKDLTSASPANYTPAPGNEKYLTVDPAGDIVLSNFPAIGGGATADNGCSTLPAGNVQLGNDLGNNTADLLNDREVNMVNNNIYFKGQAANNNGVQNAIGIGYTIIVPGASLRSKLSVLENSGIVAYAAGPGNIYTSASYFPGGANKQRGTEAISGVNQDINNNGAAPILQAGVYGESSGLNTAQGMNAGGHFFATNASSSNVGVLGVGISTSSTSVGGFFVGDNTPPSSGVSVGVWGRGLNSNTSSYGVRGDVLNPSATATNYGIYGTAPVSANNWAGWFEGNVHINGMLTFGPSDQLLKTDIDTISNASQIISQLTPRTFYFDTTNVYGINLPSSRQYGFVAQEVEPVLPELVSQIHKPEVLDSLGNVVNPSVDYKTLNYDAMIALLMKGMQEQQSVIENLTNQLNDLNAIVNNCCSQGNSLQAPNNEGTQTINYQPNIHQTDVRLTDNYCVLGENSPNPFRDHTVINYELAENIQSAQIVFYNMVGQIIKVLEINDRGLGRLNVYGDDLRSGMYSYSLIVDGNVCETKKMIKE